METRPSQNLDSRWLTQTKLLPPRLREDIVARKQLLAQLHDKIFSHPLTLICAPAGYGKTTLLVALHSSLPELLCAWLSLDEEDNDPARFLSTFVAALKTLHPDCGAATLAQLASSSDSAFEPRRVMGALIIDILQLLPQPFVFVLDDLHAITEPIIESQIQHTLWQIRYSITCLNDR